MEDSFKVRVDRAFGTLQASSSSPVQSTSSSLNSLWCLTDEEIETNRWIQDKIDPHKDNDELIHRLKNPKPYSPFLQGLLAQPSTSNQDLEADIQELDDGEEDEDDDDDDENNRQPQLSKPDDHSNEDWDIRTSVGMDCTLDNEEEEDAYDKVAVGKEESADRFYMKAVNDYEVDIDSNNELPSSLTDVIRDPRANHKAAKLRLKEDDESARKLGLQVSGNNIQEPDLANEMKEHFARATFREPESLSTVPDHVLNPSKYTHYTFDSMDDIDEESNRKAYMEFFKKLRGSSDMEMQDDFSADAPTSIIFTPRKESSDVSMKNNKEDGHEIKKVVPISIIADGEVSMMDEDEPEIATSKNSSLRNGGRRYRTKGSTHVK